MLQIIFDIVVIILLIFIIFLQVSNKVFITGINQVIGNLNHAQNRLVQIIGSINILAKDINDLKSIIINRTHHGSKRNPLQGLIDLTKPSSNLKEETARIKKLLDETSPRNAPLSSVIKEDIKRHNDELKSKIYKEEMAKHTSKVTITKTIIPALKMLRFNLVPSIDHYVAINEEHGMKFILKNNSRLHYNLREHVKDYISSTIPYEDWFNSPFKIIINKTK